MMREDQQFNSKEDFSTGNFDLLENVDMTNSERGKFLRFSNAQSNETSVEKYCLQRCVLLTRADQEDTASVSGISELLQLAEEPRAQILKPDLEIPPQAQITSIPLSYFPPKVQQLMSARRKYISEVRQATEIPTVTYIWPVIKIQVTSSPIRGIFQKPFIPTSQDLTRHCSSSDVVIADVNCSQTAPVKQLAQEKLDRKPARLCTLIVKSSNSVVSEALKSLINIENKDYQNMLPLSSINPMEEQLRIPQLEEGNALVIYSGQVYLLYVKRHEALSPEMKIGDHDILLRKTTFCLMTCSIRHIMPKVPLPPLSREYVVKQNINFPTTLASHTHQDKTSNAKQFSSHRMTAISQPKQSSPSTGKRQQPAFLSKEGWQKKNKKEACWEEDNELRKKFGIVKGVRVHLKRIILPELTEDSAKASVLGWKVTTRTKKWEKVPKQTLPLESVLPKIRKESLGISEEERTSFKSLQIP